jgi:hypothetical protein
MKQNYSHLDSDTIAILALGYIASDSELLGPFLDITGLDPANIRAAAQDPSFLSAVGEYLLNNESLLIRFAGDQNLSPESVARACQKLSGMTPE